MGYRLWVIGLVALLLCACTQQAPQRPSQRKGQAPAVDSAQLALMEMNMRLAEAADQQVLQAVQAQQEPYALYEAQTWMTILEQGDTQRPQPKNGESCTVHMKVFNLDGKLLVDSEGSYRLGKGELPKGIDDNLPELYPGTKVRMYLPWYIAFGQQGTEHIPPYENVMIELDLR